MITRSSILTAVLAGLVFFAGCSSSDNTGEAQSAIENTKAHFVPDSRVNLFTVEAKQGDGGSLVLAGETTLPQAKRALLDSLRSRNMSVIDSVEVLPSDSLKGKTYGLVNNSVANIRSNPRHSAQLVTQAILGMPLRVLKKDGGWYLVQTPEDYIGWVDSGGLEPIDRSAYDAWAQAEKVIYTDTYGFSYASETAQDDEKVSDLVAGSITRLEGRSGSFHRVVYPDGRRAYIRAAEAKPFSEWKQDLQITQQSLVETSRTMMGAPYLWGGTSTKGVDCSGFTKTVYFMNGMVIPRDASQQVHAGMQVDTTKNWDSLEVGDLLFFGRPATEEDDRSVVHVGMWIGNDQFIHSAGRVHISSVDSTAENYDPFNVGRYLEARRYLDHDEGNIIKTANIYSEL